MENIWKFTFFFDNSFTPSNFFTNVFEGFWENKWFEPPLISPYVVCKRNFMWPWRDGNADSPRYPLNLYLIYNVEQNRRFRFKSV